VPSLHCGFALAVSLALAGSMRRRWTRALALTWAPISPRAIARSTISAPPRP
jgi:hypothetical protein